MSANFDFSERELMYIDILNHYINGVTTLVVNRMYYSKLIDYDLIDILTFNLIVK